MLEVNHKFEPQPFSTSPSPSTSAPLHGDSRNGGNSPPDLAGGVLGAVVVFFFLSIRLREEYETF